MNIHFKKLWIDALRSGKYSQTQGRLRIEDSYCCLGVICDLLVPDEWEFAHINEETGLTHYTTRGNAHDVLPGSLADILGIDWDTQNKLVDINDSGKSFLEIADWIEKNL